MPTVFYADKDCILCQKPAGMPSQPDPTSRPDLLTELSKAYPSVRLVHRLDSPTGGVMIYAPTPAAAAPLSALVQDHERLQKEYLAVLTSPPPTPSGDWEDELYHDKRQNKAYALSTPRKGSKHARLAYQTLAVASDGHTLVLVRLYTGRTHQIRVQFASRGLPLVGDGKYGSREKCPWIGLWSYRMTFPHPRTGAPVSATSIPDIGEAPWSYFKDTLETFI